MYRSCLPLTAETIDPKILEELRKIFEVEKLESRSRLIEYIDNFIKSKKIRKGETYEVPVLILRGEWGEGKTAAFNMYIKPISEKNNVMPIRSSMVTILNDIVPRYINSIDFTDLRGELNYPLLILYLAVCSSDEAPDVLCKDNVKAYKELLKYLKTLTLKGYKGLLVFIDEFEELLEERYANRTVRIGNFTFTYSELFGYLPLREINRDTGRRLLSDIIEELGDMGINEFTLYIVYAVTPYAYIEFFSTMKDQVRGKIERTLFIIDLKPLNRLEAYKAVKGLLKYYTNIDKLDRIFVDPRLVSTLHIISLGNFAAINNLMCHLLSDLPSDKKIDVNLFIRKLKGHKIHTYLGEREAISVENLNRINKQLNLLGNEIVSKIIITDLIDEISAEDKLLVRKANKLYEEEHRFPLISSTYACMVNEFLLSRITNLIVSYLLDIIPSSSTIMKTREEEEELRKSIISRVYNLVIPLFNGNYLLYIPKDEYTFNTLLSLELNIRVTRDEINDLISSIDELIKRNNVYHVDNNAMMLSGYVIQTIFPPPLPTVLASCREPTKCMKLWFDIREELRLMQSKTYKDIISAFIDLIKYSMANEITLSSDKDIIELERYEGYSKSIQIRFNREGYKEPININLVTIYARNLNKDNIGYFKSYIKEYLGAYHAIILIGIDMDRNLAKDLNKIPLLSVLAIDKNTLMDIMAVYKASKEEYIHSSELYKSYMIFKPLIKDLLEKISKDLINEGVIVKDIKNFHKVSVEFNQLLEATFLGYNEHIDTMFIDPNEAWEHFRNIGWIKPYFRRIRGAIGIDVETKSEFLQKIQNIINIGIANDIFTIESDKILINLYKNKVIKRIKEYVYKRGTVSLSKLHSRFIDASQSMSKYEVIKVYLSILEMLGLLRVEGNYVSRAKEAIISSEVEEYISTIKRKMNELFRSANNILTNIRELFEIKDIGINTVLHLIYCKKHGCKAITAEYIEEKILQDTIGKLLEMKLPPKAYSIINILKIIDDHLKCMENAINSIQKYLGNIYEFNKKLDNSTKEVIRNLKNLSNILGIKSEIIRIYDYNMKEIDIEKTNFERKLKTLNNIINKISHPPSFESISPYKLSTKSTYDRVELEKNYNNALLIEISSLLGKLENYYKNYEFNLNKANKLLETVIQKIVELSNISKRLSTEEEKINLYILLKKLTGTKFSELNDILRSKDIEIDILINTLESFDRILFDAINDLRSREEKIRKIRKTIYNLRGEIKEFSLKVNNLFNDIDFIRSYLKNYIDELNEKEPFYKIIIRYINSIDPLLDDLKEILEKAKILNDELNKISNINTAILRETEAKLDKYMKDLIDIKNKYKIIQDKFKTYADNIISDVGKVINLYCGLLLNSGSLYRRIYDPYDIDRCINACKNISDIINDFKQLITNLSQIIKIYKLLLNIVMSMESMIHEIICPIIKVVNCDNIVHYIMTSIREGKPITYSELNKLGIKLDEYLDIIKSLLERGIIKDVYGRF